MPAVRADSRITLHPLRSRPDNGEWITGRMQTGTFVALSEPAHHVVRLLGQGLALAEVLEQLKARYGPDSDLPALIGFVEHLADYGFVAAVDGHILHTPIPRPTFPAITPRRARWALHPAGPYLLLALLAGAAVALLADPRLLPSYRDLLISSYASISVAAMFATGWSILFLHELGHLLAARATGVPARMSLGTRLQFLVAQTDISGIELAPRRHRLTAYLAGLTVNLAVASLAVLAAAGLPPRSAVAEALALIAVMALVPIPFQCMVFMRTDVYFVLQDLTNCRDLYGQGRAYARYCLRRARAGLRPGKARPEDPSRRLPGPERRAVHVYTVVQVVGTALCLGFLLAVTLPADIALLTHAGKRAVTGHTLPERADGAVVLLFLGGVHVLWARTKWRSLRAARSLSG
jgi:hypothetical protein